MILMVLMAVCYSKSFCLCLMKEPSGYFQVEILFCAVDVDFGNVFRILSGSFVAFKVINISLLQSTVNLIECDNGKSCKTKKSLKFRKLR